MSVRTDRKVDQFFMIRIVPNPSRLSSAVTSVRFMSTVAAKKSAGWVAM